MAGLTRRTLVAGMAVTGASGLNLRAAQAQTGFMAASVSHDPDQHGGGRQAEPGIQSVTALCEVTGGGEKVYGVAIEYDAPIDPASLTRGSFALGVVPASPGFFPGMPQAPDKNQTSQAAMPRKVVAIYTSDAPALRSASQGGAPANAPSGGQAGRGSAGRKSMGGRYVIAAFAQDPDLSLPTRDSDKVEAVQTAPVRSLAGRVYPASAVVWRNTERHGARVAIRGVTAWEQNHWWWDDDRSTFLEYSIYLPQSFLAPGGEKKAYPLLLAVTHSGTSPDGTCAQTLTEQCIATIWSLPENQARHECVIVTPRYERTTMNDYWEHTNDVENTQRLVEFLLSNRWNFGNPNLADRRDKVLRIDPMRVYCTGWSMGAMTSLWLMATHPQTYAAGLIIAGQQRPADMEPLARQNLLIITGSEDDKATPWNEKCVPVWREAGGKVTRPSAQLDPAMIFPIDRQQALTAKVNEALDQRGNITFLTFAGVDHMGSARKFFYIEAAREWLFRQIRAEIGVKRG